jgi:hypothetical protein
LSRHYLLAEFNRRRTLMGVPNLRETRELWKSLGGSIEDIRRTGEERYSHPKLECPITVNKRRKDSPRKLASALRQLACEDVPREITFDKREKADKLPKELETYSFPLRPNFKVELYLPVDLSLSEASRLADFVKSQLFSRKSAMKGV